MNKYKLFILILLMGAALRLLHLGEYMPALFRDEAALGYNAYSIWLTGRDEYGVLLPVFFRSFEVFFMPAYVYLSAPIVGVLGLNIFSTRLLSSISGIIALIIIYKVASEMWGKRAGIFSMLALAVSPWHIFYSRGAFEGNLGLTFFVLGFYLWIKFIKHRKIFLFFVSSVSFAFSMYSYQAERLVVPLFALVAVLVSYKLIWKNKKKIVIPAALVFLFLVPLLVASFKPVSFHRAAGVSVFETGNPPGWTEGRDASLFINNSLHLRFQQISSLYLSYFSPKNLFVEPDSNLQRRVENISVFYVWMMPFMIYGLVKVLSKRDENKIILLAFVLFAPLPAALTGDPFHTYRSLLLYFPLTMLVGLGLSEFIGYVRHKRVKLFVTLSILVVIALSVLIFIYSYITITPVKRATVWDYGYEELMQKVSSLPKESKISIFDDMTESYIHYLFFLKVSPVVYHTAVLDNTPDLKYYYEDPDVLRPVKVNNLEFREVDWPTERGDKGSYFVFASHLLPESEFVNDPNVELIDEIFYPDNSSAFRIVKIKNE